MSQKTEPTAPPLEAGAPPSYDEAVGIATSFPNSQSVLNPAQVTNLVEKGETLEKKENQNTQAPPLNNASPPFITTQPQPQAQTTYNFVQPLVYQSQPPSSNDCCLCCLWCDGEDIADLCYCIFCCSRHVTGHDAGCCARGDTCCGCPEGCCDCGDCDCDCGDCDCGDCDCGDCNCDCGDCTII